MGVFRKKKSNETTSEATVQAAGRGAVESAPDPRTGPQANGRENAGAAKTRLSGNAAQSSSVMNPHMFIEGNIRYEGMLTIDCEVKGKITTEDTLVIGPSAKVQAEITAGTVEIAGKVSGNIRARNRVRIVSGGEVHGNIETPSISMEEGVVFEGKCSRPQAQAQPQPRPRTVGGGITQRAAVYVRPQSHANAKPEGAPDAKGEPKPSANNSTEEKQKAVEAKP